MKNNKLFGVIAGWFTAIGALNWGLVGAFKFNLVESIFKVGTLTDIVYILVGISAIYSIYRVVLKK